MQGRNLCFLSLVFWLQVSGLASAATPPAKVVEQFIEAHLQGQFATSRSFALERVNLSNSLFSNWLFGPGAAGGDAPTADLFLSRKFTQAFRYSIIGTTPTGDNQVMVAVLRASPNLAHMYTWALAPKRGSAPYELIEAVDAYLTKVNYPVEESRMQFVLVREVDSWYISNVMDEKFSQLQQMLQGQTQLSAAVPLSGASAATGAGGAPGAPPAATPPAATPPAATASSDIGRQLADAQFNATLQGFNRASQGLTPASGSGGSTAPKQDEDQPGFFGKVSRAIFGSKKNDAATTKDLAPVANATLRNVRDAIARFAAANSGVPEINQIYDWKSLRRVVNQYGRTSLPATEEEAGFTFVDYKPAPSREAYLLVVDLREPQDGVKRVEIEDTTALRSTPR
jgi:hypothetical protein